MKKALKWVGIVLAVLLVAAGSAYGWASWKASALLEEVVDVHEVDFPIPFPLTEGELEALRRARTPAPAEDPPAEPPAPAGEGAAVDPPPEGEAAPAEVPPPAAADPLAGVDLEALALERAVARGQHLIEARYACNDCHGADLGGGTMVDDPMMGRLLGPNLTTGRGSRTLDYEAADWDRIVRHGVTRDRRPTAMPAQDFERMSDQELSDIVAYIRSLPPVDAETEPVSLGPLGTVLLATGKLPLSARLIRDHQADHLRRPPRTEATAQFGAHLAAVCAGCHRATFEGGPVAAGPPDWPPARNLTPHAEGLSGWTYEDFVRAMREARRPDGTPIAFPMSGLTRYAAEMTDVELRALWVYLQSVPPAPTGQ